MVETLHWSDRGGARDDLEESLIRMFEQNQLDSSLDSKV